MHLELGFPDPAVSDMYEVKLVLIGVNKEKGKEVHRMAPITPEVLLLLRTKLNLEDHNDVTFWAACLVGFFGLLRRSNLFPPALSRFDPKKHLSRTCVSRALYGFLITLPWSKTIQHKERKLLIPLLRVPGHPLCPVHALDTMFSMFPDAGKTQPLFLRRVNGSLTPVLYGWFASKLGAVLTSCSLDASLYGSHSLRRGGATWALHCGASPEIIQMLGDWHSDAYKAYLEVSLHDKISTLETLIKHLPCLSRDSS